MAEIVMSKEEGNLQEEDKMKQLPPDIIMEILIRTDIESLPRLRWVCKEWRRLLSHTYLINHHHQKAKNIRGFILDDTSEDKYEACRSYDIFFFPHPGPPRSESLPSLTFLLEPVKIKASTPHGLLLCFGLVHECYYVCKPTTKEWSPIPSPNTQNQTITMAMSVASTSPLRFKIMRISRYRGKLKFLLEVFDSDSCGMWKTIEEGIGTSLDGNRLSMSSVNFGVVVNGSFYWISHKGHYQVTKVMCVDLWAEEVKTLELPEAVATEDVNAKSINRLSNFNGGLGLVRSGRNMVFDFWVMTSMVEQKWVKVKVLDMGDDLFAAVRYAWMREDYIVDNILLMKPNRNRREIFWCVDFALLL